MLRGFLVIAADFLTDEDSESQREEVMCPRISLENGGADFKPMFIISGSPFILSIICSYQNVLVGISSY